MSQANGYWIQLIAYPPRHHSANREPHFRAQVMLNNTPVARTVNLWPENAGCGRAAAIHEAQAIIGQLQCQSWVDGVQRSSIHGEQTISLNTDPVEPYSVYGKWLAWIFTLWYVLIILWALNK